MYTCAEVHVHVCDNIVWLYSSLPNYHILLKVWSCFDWLPISLWATFSKPLWLSTCVYCTYCALYLQYMYVSCSPCLLLSLVVLVCYAHDFHVHIHVYACAYIYMYMYTYLCYCFFLILSYIRVHTQMLENKKALECGLSIYNVHVCLRQSLTGLCSTQVRKSMQIHCTCNLVTCTCIAGYLFGLAKAH